MTTKILLDTRPLGRISPPRPNREIADWLEGLLRQGATIYIPEIADYEVRRELIRAGLQESINRLDLLQSVLNYLPINTAVTLKAAELWAKARTRGTPTADPKALDADVILAAQALQISGLIAIKKVGHLSLFVDAKDWRSSGKP